MNKKSGPLPLAQVQQHADPKQCMKVVLVDTRKGLLFAGDGKYTSNLEKALGFQDTSRAAEFCKKSRLSDHNVALRFSDACLDFAKTQVSS
ncbi:MAG: hypothetical protein ACK4UN_04970 [Limisphaerales bacterium]